MPYVNGRYLTQDQFNKLKKKQPHIHDGYSSTSGGLVSDLFTLITIIDSITSDNNSYDGGISSSDFSSGGGDFGGGGSSGDW